MPCLCCWYEVALRGLSAPVVCRFITRLGHCFSGAKILPFMESLLASVRFLYVIDDNANRHLYVLIKLTEILLLIWCPGSPAPAASTVWVQMFSYSWSVATKTKSGLSTLRASPVGITPIVTHLNQETSLEEEPGVGFLPHLIFVSALL